MVQARVGDGSSDDGASGDRFSEAELSSMVALLLVTGHETTVNLIGNGALALLQHPAQLAWLREHEEGWDTAVAELLRYDGPVETSTTRWVRADFTFKGCAMRRGDVVRVCLASANRDTAYFDQPDELDVTRTDNKHLAFGHGIHYCLGAPLARLEGQIALQTLFTRFPAIRLAVPPDELVWRSGVLFRGLKSLPLQK
ncbi:MAG: cytochrome P450 [Anaerolineae bacterium]|nr:cytochrome P450 [Anaerolineae bacterium]